jgi:hypothetical protein
MPERRVDIDTAMHELGQRLRAAWNKKHVVPVGVLEIAKQETLNQWQIEEQIERDVERRKRDAPKIEPPKREPDEPGIEP